jgi:PTS system nitrogen regulatory IIA component
MKIEEFLAPGSVVELRASDKRNVITELARRAASVLSLDASAVTKALLAREELGSTGMGEGFALPHARLAGVEKPFGIFARLGKPVDFDAVDGLPVDLVFLLLLPINAQGDQLNALACVARRLRDHGTAERLRRTRDAAGAFPLLVGDGTA